MALLPHVGIEYVEEDEAQGEVAEIYDDVRRTLQIPFVPNGVKATSGALSVLSAYWGMYKTLINRITLPPTLISMLTYAIASSNDCTYCASWNELSCRTYGVDDETLEAMTKDLPNLSPQRVRAIIQFGLKMVHTPQSISPEDYDALRDQGVSDEEMIEIVLISAVGQLNDILADTLKIDLDAMVGDALGREQTIYKGG